MCSRQLHTHLSAWADVRSCEARLPGADDAAGVAVHQLPARQLQALVEVAVGAVLRHEHVPAHVRRGLRAHGHQAVRAEEGEAPGRLARVPVLHAPAAEGARCDAIGALVCRLPAMSVFATYPTATIGY